MRLGVRSQESGDRRQETGDRRQETGDRRQETRGSFILPTPHTRSAELTAEAHTPHPAPRKSFLPQTLFNHKKAPANQTGASTIELSEISRGQALPMRVQSRGQFLSRNRRRRRERVQRARGVQSGRRKRG